MYNSTIAHLNQYLRKTHQNIVPPLISYSEIDLFSKNIQPKSKSIKSNQATASFENISLISRFFQTCTPLVIKDHLNKWSMLFHIHSENSGFNKDQMAILDIFPKGMLEAVFIKTLSTREDMARLGGDLLKLRDDIFSMREYEIPIEKNYYYNVRYDISQNIILIHDSKKNDTYSIPLLSGVNFTDKKIQNLLEVLRSKMSLQDKIHLEVNF